MMMGRVLGVFHQAASRPVHRNGFFALAVLVVIIANVARSEVTSLEKREIKMKVIEMFNHAYSSYMTHAYPADELMPLSCKGRYRGSEPDRGDVDETLGNFSLTLIDTLDTLAVLGNITELDRAVKLVIKNVKFDADVVVSVFETNIRVLGGLLGGHVVAELFRENKQGLQWYQGELLDMAVDIADRLLVAFNTTTGIPYPRINLLYGVHHPMSRLVDERDTCTACAGTMIMEFAALSRLTGNPIYEEKAHKAMDAIWHYRSRSSDLVGTVINIHNGDWIRRDSGIGAGIDSYYEYCFKAYILLGDKSYLEKFNKHYAAINKYVKQGVMMLDVLMHQPERPIRSFVDSLQAFWPGLQVLMGDLKPAIETHEMLYEVVRRHKFIPEAFTTNYDVYWAQHPLRPEFAESTYFLYEATKDPYYLEAGKHIVETLELHARVPCGFAAIQDLRTFTHEDKMDSFVLAETFKYLYLLFSEESERALNIHNFVFTTEAHLLPLSLSNVIFEKNINKTKQDVTKQTATSASTDDPQSSCPNNALNKYSLKEFARVIRKEYRRPQQVPQCNSDNVEQKLRDTYLNADPNREPKLRAEHFQVGNSIHLQLLKEMGITVVQSADGKVQLMHQAGTAATPEDATDGIKFMQEMIQIAKTKIPDQGIVHKPRIVQLTSPPFNGKVSFGAGAAQFGIDISSHIGVTSEVVQSIPYNACDEIINKDEFLHRIVIAERGSCMFIDKVRRAQKLGALGVIIVDHNEGTSGDAQPIFAMSGDAHSEDVTIPSVFLFRKEGDLVRHYAEESREKHGTYLSVRLAGKVKETNPESASHKTDEAPESTENQPDKELENSESSKVVHTVHSNRRGTTIAHKPFNPKECPKPEGANEIAVDKQQKDEDLEEGTVMESSTESHVGRDANGNMVEYVTTYTSYRDQEETTTKIRMSTKAVPFQSNLLEIDKSSLEKDKNVLQSQDGVADEQTLSESQMLKKNLDVAVEDDKTSAMNDVVQGTRDASNNRPKQDAGPLVTPGQDETTDETKASMNDGKAQNMETKDELKSNIDTPEKAETEKKPGNVICNSAGCFSSLEELEMFNGLAHQVRSSLHAMEVEEAAATEQQPAQNEANKDMKNESDRETESPPSNR